MDRSDEELAKAFKEARKAYKAAAKLAGVKVEDDDGPDDGAVAAASAAGSAAPPTKKPTPKGQTSSPTVYRAKKSTQDTLQQGPAPTLLIPLSFSRGLFLI